MQKFFLLVACVFISGCTSSTRVLLTDRLPGTPNQTRNIMVYLENPPIASRPLAIVSVARRGENSVWAVEALKDEAAEIGADALTNLEMSYTPGLMPELKVQAVAVKYGK